MQSGRTEGAEHDERLTAAAAVARAVLEGNRSDRLLRLFDYLLAKSLAGVSPSEQQIASEAFVSDTIVEVVQDANVRVYVHRLRKLIDSAFVGTTGPKIYIPVGEYRIRLLDDPAVGEPPATDGQPAVSGSVLARLRRSRVAMLALALFVIGALALVWSGREDAPLARTPAWQPFDGRARPLTIVVGDYYLFALLDDQDGNDAAPQLVWDKSVPTREDLTIFQMLNPETAHKTVDYNQHFVSGGTIEALSAIRHTISRVPAVRRSRLRLVAASQLTPEMLSASDIIYVGQFSGMPVLLRDPLAQASGFSFSSGFDSLTDKADSRRYQSDGMVLTDDRIARRDFAYLAGFPGPAGNRILVIAGLGDPGLKEAAEVAGDADQLLAIRTDAGRRKNGFEALFRVRTIKSVNVGATLVVDRALRSGEIWDNSGNVPAYRPIEVNPAPAARP